MNQKGFATILGLCLILAIALVVKGIQESEGNQSYETTDFQTELNLQNAAEIGIYKAAAKVKGELIKDENYLPFNWNYSRKSQKEVINESMMYSSNRIDIHVWGERMLILPYKVDYAPDPDVANKINDGKTIEQRKCYGFFSKAELTNPRTGGKLYRRAFGYVLLEEDDTSDWRLHFLNVADKNNYYIETENPYKK